MKGSRGYRDLGKPRTYVTDRDCRQKSRFTDEAQARAAAAYALEHPRPYEGPRERLWVYRCRHCSGWHMTSKNTGPRFVVTREEAHA